MTPRRHQVLISVVAASLGLSACYSAGDGTDPPNKSFYFPVGVTVSRGGSVLYVVNSDFDLQWNGGTVQSYDLQLIRRHTVLAINDPTDPALPLLRPVREPWLAHLSAQPRYSARHGRLPRNR